MKKYVRNLIYQLLCFSGFPALYRRTKQKNRFTILLFHEFPEGEIGEKIIKYLIDKYSVISLQQLTQIMINSKWDDLPQFSLIITLDDARLSNQHLIPLIKKYGPLSPTIYISTAPHRLDGRKYFDKDMVLQTSDFFDFQAHTINHPSLPSIGEEEAVVEIVESRKILNSWFNKDIFSFAYPYGHYSKKDYQIVKAAGYSNAVTVDYGLNDKDTDPFLLKRICISDAPTLSEVKVKASGIWNFVKSTNPRR